MSRTVYVGNLAWSTTADDLRDVINAIAPVQTVDIQLHNDTGRSKGWALVKFERREGALKAIEMLNRHELAGRPMYLREDRTEIEQEEGFVVFVGNLPWEMTAEELKNVFAHYGPYDVHIKTNMSGRSRGFGLLRFHTSEEAQRVIEHTHGSAVGEREILVRLDRAHLEMMGKTSQIQEVSETVTVGNVSWHSGDEVLACHMAQAGRLVSCQIQRHSDTLRSKGWAIVRYVTPDEGSNAVRTLHRTVLDGRTLNVRFYKPYTKSTSSSGGFPSPPYGSQQQQQQQQQLPRVLQLSQGGRYPIPSRSFHAPAGHTMHGFRHESGMPYMGGYHHHHQQLQLRGRN